MRTRINNSFISRAKLGLLPILFFIVSSCAAQSDDEPIDFHAHIFSPTMLAYLESMGMDLTNWGCVNGACDNIDTIQSKSAKRMLLISTGYIYNDSSTTKEMELVQAENDYLYKTITTQPNNLVGFAGINPLRPYALKEIKRCIEELKIQGIKLHFQNNNIDLTQPEVREKMQPLFEYISKNNVPVLIHNNAWNKEAGSKLAEIYIMHYLTKMPLTIIYAHLGGGAFFTKFNQDFIETFIRLSDENTLMGKAYFDISAIVLERRHSAMLPEKLPIESQLDLMKKIGFEQLLFGTDYPISNVNDYKRLIDEEWKLDETTLSQLLNKKALFNEFLKK